MNGFFLDVFHTVIIIAILVGALILSQLARKALNRYASKASEKFPINPTTFSFLKNAVSFAIFALAMIVVINQIPGLETLATTLWASAGILSVVIGLATQQTFGNIVSGIFIIIYKPFRIGDTIQLPNGKSGTVEDITLQFTFIKNAENSRIIIPNAVINRDYIINSSIIDDRVTNQIEIKIVPENNLDKAIEILKELAINHPDFYDNRTSDELKKDISPVTVRVTDILDSHVSLQLTVWCISSDKSLEMKSDLLLAIKKRFDAEGIKI